jgi:peptidyl-prolyl cis-trans isomerase B (cyclophilin B)
MYRLLLATLTLGLFAGYTQAANTIVVMETSMGTIKIELFDDKAPITVQNFLKYADDKFYDGTIFHRVIPTFMVQGGGFEPGLKEKATRDAIKNESANGLSNVRGTLAMARTPRPDSATAQFFINVKDNGFLNHTAPNPQGWGYCVFGKVAEGRDIVDRIKAVKTAKRGFHDDVPVEDVIIERAEVV